MEKSNNKRKCYIYPLHAHGEVVAMFGTPQHDFWSLWFAVRPDGEEEVYLFAPKAVRFDERVNNDLPTGVCDWELSVQELYVQGFQRGIPLLPQPSTMPISMLVHAENQGDVNRRCYLPLIHGAANALKSLGLNPIHICNQKLSHDSLSDEKVCGIKVKEWIGFLEKQNKT